MKRYIKSSSFGTINDVENILYGSIYPFLKTTFGVTSIDIDDVIDINVSSDDGKTILFEVVFSDLIDGVDMRNLKDTLLSDLADFGYEAYAKIDTNSTLEGYVVVSR